MILPLASVRCRDPRLAQALGAKDSFNDEGRGIIIKIVENGLENILWWPLIEGADAPLPRGLR